MVGLSLLNVASHELFFSPLRLLRVAVALASSASAPIRPLARVPHCCALFSSLLFLSKTLISAADTIHIQPLFTQPQRNNNELNCLHQPPPQRPPEKGKARNNNPTNYKS
ncbi:hypothetical protein K440DRAFT_152721 [Wilcoxina mikolae CBS 423.85]|nr:hypothetical protein K440DRAFT_152721 [Wilcoxina mikolae CBS 423.85]